MGDEVNEIRKRKENKRGTGKWSENNNSDISLNAKQVTVDKVGNSETNSDNYNNDSEIMMNNNKEVVENGVSKNDTLSNSSNDENTMGVEVSSDGVVISIDELEEGYEESFSRYGGVEGKFFQG